MAHVYIFIYFYFYDCDNSLDMNSVNMFGGI